METLRVVGMAILALAVLWFIYKEIQRETQRQELAKKNMSFIESIHLTGLPIITFHNGDDIVNMVLDTGSNVCMIDKNALQHLIYTVKNSHDGVLGVNGSTDGGRIVLLPLSYKKWNFDFECWEADMQSTLNTFKTEYGVTIHGILGTEFLTQYKYILDFDEMVAYSQKED